VNLDRSPHEGFFLMSLARRTLRTTAAAAGIAAVGVGLAAPAFAAPELPAAPSTDELGALPAAPDASAAQHMLAALPAAPTSMPDLPTLVSFEMPSMTTAGPELPAAPDAHALPAAPELPAAPDAHALPAAPELPAAPDLPSFEGTNQVNGPSTDPAHYLGQNEVGAMSALDTAKAMTELAQKAMSGQSMTQGNSFG
jgi:hypothetical protein